MGNQVRVIAIYCRNCFKSIREGSPLQDLQNEKSKVHQLVDLSKNPSSDVSQIIDQNRLSFAIDNFVDQSFDSCKLPKSPEDGDTSITVTQPSVKYNASPQKTTTITKHRSLQQPPLKKTESLERGTNFLTTQIFNKEKTLTEESPMLEPQELKSEPSFNWQDEPSKQERINIPFISDYGLENLQSVGELAMKQFNEICQEDQGFQFLYSQDGIVLHTKDYQTEEKFLIIQLKYKYVSNSRYSYNLNTTLDKFESFQLDVEKQKQIEPSIDVYNVLASFDDHQLITMRQKKIVFLDAKEYFYVKHTQKQDDIYRAVCKSVNIPDITSPLISNPKKVIQKGVIYLTGIQVKEVADHIEIEGYTEANLKLKLPFSMIKKVLCSEFQAMVERQKIYFTEEQ